ncbi:hypothetical protein ACHQM5_009670 [Ranunculus cassubicifolius]
MMKMAAVHQVLVRPLWCHRRRLFTTTTVSSIRQNPQQKKRNNLLPYSTPLSPLDFQSRGLRLAETPLLQSDVEESVAISEEEKKSRNEKKREARRAVLWAMEIATFTNPQIKRILSAASLEKEVFDAIMTVKRFGHDVREGKRRQFNYIGRLLRDVQPELMNELIQATKDGDQSKLQELFADKAPVLGEDDEDGEEIECEEEEEGDFNNVASRWFDGLVSKDTEITNEVYSIYDVEFDRQELRKLVRRVHNIQMRPEEESGAALVGANKSLHRFLRSLAKQRGV